MAAPLLQVEGLGKRFGGFVALEAIELSVRNGERVGLIGPDGSGKSTLVNCMCGTLRHEMGSVRFAGQTLDGLSAHERTRLGLARSFQLPRPFNTLSLLFIWLDPTTFNVVALTISIVIDLVIIWLLQDADIQRLYQPGAEQRRGS